MKVGFLENHIILLWMQMHVCWKGKNAFEHAVHAVCPISWAHVVQAFGGWPSTYQHWNLYIQIILSIYSNLFWLLIGIFGGMKHHTPLKWWFRHNYHLPQKLSLKVDSYDFLWILQSLMGKKKRETYLEVRRFDGITGHKILYHRDENQL